MSISLKSLGKWTAGLFILACVLTGSILVLAHLDIAEERTPLPLPAEIVDKLEADQERGPTQLYWVNTASQTVPRSSVMETLDKEDGGEDFIMSFAAFILEWADGRLLLVDVGMDEAGARAFGAPLELLGIADPMQPHASVAEELGEASQKVDGVIFTHLHADHVGGIEALCKSRDFKARVFTTEAQAERPNFTTSGGLDLLLENNCVLLTTLDEGPLHSLDDFPGIAIIRAGGHTPGSQLVVARIGSGPTARNVVFTGDIVNQAEAIPLDRGKPLLYRTFIVPEDEVRQSSLRKFLRSLEQEHAFSPLVSHDQARLEASGLSLWPGPGTSR